MSDYNKVSWVYDLNTIEAKHLVDTIPSVRDRKIEKAEIKKKKSELFSLYRTSIATAIRANIPLITFLHNIFERNREDLLQLTIEQILPFMNTAGSSSSSLLITPLSSPQNTLPSAASQPPNKDEKINISDHPSPLNTIVDLQSSTTEGNPPISANDQGDLSKQIPIVPEDTENKIFP